MRFHRTRTLAVAAAALLVALSAPAALAGNLTEASVKQFAGSLDDIKALQKKLEERGIDTKLTATMTPKPGEPFQPFTNGVSTLKKEDADLYGELATVTDKHGYSSPIAWAEVGDAVVIAYAAIRIGDDPNAKNMMAQITPEMLDQVPPNMRAQFEGMLALVEHIENADPDDVEAVRAALPELDRVFDLHGMGGSMNGRPMGGPMGGR